MAVRKSHYKFGEYDRLVTTKPCPYCNGRGYRLVHRHIEVECTRCNGKGYTMTHVTASPRPKDPQT